MKILATLALALASVGASVGGLMETVGASASGCTSAPGAAGAQNCIDVSGFGTFVGNAQSSYSSGYAPVNVCNPQGKFKYMRAGSSYYSYAYRSASTCGWWKGWVDFYSPGEMKSGSNFCATQKNSVISEYANMACVGIWA